jgi:hypothetical protein
MLTNQAYLAQVADYITKRAGQPPPTLGGSTQSTAQNQQSAGGFSGVGDPTGFATNVSNSYGSNGSGSSAAVSKHFPVKSYLVFETGDVSKVSVSFKVFTCLVICVTVLFQVIF